MFVHYIFIVHLCVQVISMTSTKDACLQIYSVPKQDIICDPPQEVLDRIDNLAEKLSKLDASIASTNSRIDEMDPGSQQELPPDLLAKMAQIGTVAEIQDSHTEILVVVENETLALQKNVAVLENRLMTEIEARVAFQKQVEELKIQYNLLTQETVARVVTIQNLQTSLEEISAIVDRWQHLMPRALKVHDCHEALKFYEPVSGVYSINPSPAMQPYDVFCDMTPGDDGWTVIQRRMDGSVDFFRGWLDYSEGFGTVDGEFWLGLQRIHVLTTSRSYKLRIDLEDWTGRWWNAEYGQFSIGSEDTDYELFVDGYTGNAGDTLSYHSGVAFSTMDHNNDNKGGLCPTWCHGAWWYKDCYLSNLNGRYYEQGPYIPDTNWGDGVNWKTTFNTYYYSFKTAEMKIKPVNAEA